MELGKQKSASMTSLKPIFFSSITTWEIQVVVEDLVGSSQYILPSSSHRPILLGRNRPLLTLLYPKLQSRRELIWAMV